MTKLEHGMASLEKRNGVLPMERPRRYFEDFAVDDTYQFGPRLVTKDAILRFAGEFDRLPFHVDEDAAKDTIYGGLIASGLHTVCVAASIVVDELLLRSSMTGSAGMTDVRWLRPVRPGDELAVNLKVAETEPLRRKASIGRVRCALTVTNQHDETVVTALVDYLFTFKSPSS
jgi:acyl dehydratase